MLPADPDDLVEGLPVARVADLLERISHGPLVDHAVEMAVCARNLVFAEFADYADASNARSDFGREEQRPTPLVSGACFQLLFPRIHQVVVFVYPQKQHRKHQTNLVLFALHPLMNMNLQKREHSKSPLPQHRCGSTVSLVRSP